MVSVSMILPYLFLYITTGFPPGETINWSIRQVDLGLSLFPVFLTSCSTPWIAIFPGLAIRISVFAFNLFRDSVRDALDPKLRVS
jgi:hypothetical protein